MFHFGMKLDMFRTVPLSIIRSFSLYTHQWYMLYNFADSLRAGSGWNCSSILILLASFQQTCTIYTYTNAVCVVENAWWWTEKLYEICGVSFENFEKLVHVFGFIIRNVLLIFRFNSRIGAVFKFYCEQYKHMFWLKSTAVRPKFFVRVPLLAMKKITVPHILALVTIGVRITGIQN
jgi:hypothetical protein